ncbi:hypothetical protein [Spirosoma montaniterrae]|uniref:Uncharacterized protein n=1 Tax=Spirosoma montaniterrae TaxID=1178516 RepID=A0A1P9WT44_9BACT|nr:hypothetical protein [Spirosoma montaniterrae]AQG78537.1 hypothetical protein AWR27_03785 [Spirosoma montaniterrae]
MATYQNDYLSEFEQEFGTDTAFETETDSGSAFEINDEFELETDSKTSAEWSNPDNENWLNEFDSREQEYEDRLYAAFNNEYESSFEMEQEIDRVLHEMETEYFFNGLKKFAQRNLGKLKSIASRYLPKNTLQSLAQLAGGNLRGLLKSDLFKKGLSFAANAVAPGIGGAIAGQLLNRETDTAPVARQQARQAVQTAKTAYQHLAQNLGNLRPGDLNAQLNSLSRQALSVARSQGGSTWKGKRRRDIPVPAGATVVVRNDRVTIYF